MLVKQADIEQIEQELHENVCQAISVFKHYFIVFPFILYIDLAISVFKRIFMVLIMRALRFNAFFRTCVMSNSKQCPAKDSKMRGRFQNLRDIKVYVVK